jgi:hypothetical protein
MALPKSDDTDAWRTIFIGAYHFPLSYLKLTMLRFTDFYQQYAPENSKMVNDTMMTKWAGKFELLYSKLEEKYIAKEIISEIKRRPGTTVGECRDEVFILCLPVPRR